jgi:hypothetical protein
LAKAVLGASEKTVLATMAAKNTSFLIVAIVLSFATADRQYCRLFLSLAGGAGSSIKVL